MSSAFIHDVKYGAFIYFMIIFVVFIIFGICNIFSTFIDIILSTIRIRIIISIMVVVFFLRSASQPSLRSVSKRGNAASAASIDRLVLRPCEDVE